MFLSLREFRVFFLVTFLLFSSLLTERAMGESLPTENMVEDASVETAPNEEVPARTVYLELDVVEDAKFYDVEVRPANNAWTEPLKIRTSGQAMRFRLSPGKYELRARSVDDRVAPGEWGRWAEFWVHFRAPENISPADKTVIEPMANTNEVVTFEWPEVPLARFYLFRLKDATGNNLRTVKTEKTWITSELAVNGKYQWSVTPLLSKAHANASDLEPIWNSLTVSTPNETLRPILFQVQPLPEVDRYQFEFVKFVGENETGEPARFDSKIPDFKVRLGPGSYEMRVRTVFKDKALGNWSAPEKFYVAIPAPQLDSPKNGARIDPSDIENEVTLKWKSIDEAFRYRVQVFNSKNVKILDETITDRFIVVKLQAGDTYTWSVQAFSQFEPVREPAANAEISVAKESFKIDPYIRLNLSTAEEPSQFYGWARQITSFANYDSRNWDTSNRIQQVLFGGSTEAAAGYWHRKSNYGLLASGSISGFTILSDTHFYNGASLLLARRKVFEDGSRLRLWLGGAYREVPEILTAGSATIFRFENISSYGPEARVSYMRSINERWGWHTFANLYFGAFGRTSANGETPFNNYSVSAGLQASYRYSEQTTAMFGYTYQAEEARYPSQDVFKNPNVARMAGHYLGFTILFGLEKAQR